MVLVAHYTVHIPDNVESIVQLWSTGADGDASV